MLHAAHEDRTAPPGLTLLSCGVLLTAMAIADEGPRPLSMSEVIEQSAPGDWRVPDPKNLVYVELESGRVIIELAAQFAPEHVRNLRTLIAQHYFDGLAIVRSQENYVVQWGDPASTDSSIPEDQREALRRPLGKARENIPGEYARPAAGLPFTSLPDGDVYAPQVGYSGGFPAARDPDRGRAWLAHCYGMVGAGRGNAADSGNGAEIYVVIGHSPRHLDRNVTLLGRVLLGMERFSVLPRGTGPLGFYTDRAQYVPLRSIRLASELPLDQRTHLQVMRTDTATFERLIAARRHRMEEWFLDPVGHVELCNVPVPVRAIPDPIQAQPRQEAGPRTRVAKGSRRY